VRGAGIVVVRHAQESERGLSGVEQRAACGRIAIAWLADGSGQRQQPSLAGKPARGLK